MSADAEAASKPTPAARERATRQARAQPLECPACEAAQAAVAALLRQGAEPGAAGAALDWRGDGALRLCNAHAWLLLAHPAPMRRLAAARLRAGLDDLAAREAAAASRGRREATPAFRAEGDCPFCAAMTAAAAELLGQHAGGADDGAAPWCIPHLCMALGLVRGRERVRAVARDAIEHLSALEADLSELIRKSDYRFRGEPRGREASSWLRAARLTAGGPGVRWPLRREPNLEG